MGLPLRANTLSALGQGWTGDPSSPGVLFSTACQGPVQKRIDSCALLAPVQGKMPPPPPLHLFPVPKSPADDTTVTDLHTGCVK